MGLFTRLAASIWRDFGTDGVPATGVYTPSKSEIRRWGLEVETAIGAGFGAGGSIAKDTRASLDADLDHDADTLAWVYADAAMANNGVYRKTGAAGSGSWSRVSDLPYAVVPLTVTGGTANAIVATSSIPVATADRGVILLLSPSSANTGAVTLAVNGETPLPIVGQDGAAMASGYLKAASMIALVRQADQYRTLNDFRVEALSAAATAAATAASSSASTASTAATAAAASASAAAGYASAANIVFYTTYALADAAIASYANGTTVRVYFDETHDNLATNYLKTGGALVFVGYADLKGIRFFVGAGQSLNANVQTYAWSPPPNVLVWNFNSSTPQTVGTAWGPADATKTNLFVCTIADEAARNPDQLFLACNTAVGGKSIAQWLDGWPYKFATSTAAGDPGSGYVRFNNATLSSVTQVYVDYLDRDGADQISETVDVSATTNKLRIYKPGAPGTYVEYTINSTTDSTGYRTFNVTYSSAAGSLSLAADDNVQLMQSPDMWEVMTANVEAAMAAYGASCPDPELISWNQGQSDVRSAAFYATHFDALEARLEAETAWFKPETSWMIGLHSPWNDPVFRAMNGVMQAVAARDPDRRAIVNPAVPEAMWVDGNLHIGGEGCLRAGRMQARQFFHSGRGIVAGRAYDPDTGFLGYGAATTPRAPVHVTWADPPAGVMQRLENSGTLGALTQYKGSGISWAIGKLPSNNHFGLLTGTDSYGAGGVAVAGTECMRVTATLNFGFNDNAPAYMASFKKSGATRGIIASINSGDSGSNVGAQIHYVQAGVANWAAGIGTDGAWHVYANRTSAADGTDVLKITSTAVSPGADNTIALGGASARWSVVYAATGTINTSDARAKANIADIDMPLLRAWSRVRAKTFQMADAVAEKGDNARRHVGYVAQDVEAAFAAEGLDARRYALWCEDAVSAPIPVKRIVRRQRVRDVTITDMVETVEGDRIVHRAVERPEQEPVVDELPVYDQAGERVMVASETGDLVPLVSRVPVYDDVEIDDTEMRPTGETRLGLRYEQCLVLDAALQRYVLGCLVAGRAIDPVIAANIGA